MSEFYNVESLKVISKKEVPATMRLSRFIFKKDRKTGIEKDSKGLFVSDVTSSLLQLISQDERGAEFLKGKIAEVQDSIVRKLVDAGKIVINSDEIDHNVILSAMAQSNESVRFSKESIAAWYKEYLQDALDVEIRAKMPGITQSQMDKLLGNYLESFQILAGRNPSMNNEIKAGLIRAMEFLPEDHDSVVACTIADKLNSVAEASVTLAAL